MSSNVFLGQCPSCGSWNVESHESHTTCVLEENDEVYEKTAVRFSCPSCGDRGWRVFEELLMPNYAFELDGLPLWCVYCFQSDGHFEVVGERVVSDDEGYDTKIRSCKCSDCGKVSEAHIWMGRTIKDES